MAELDSWENSKMAKIRAASGESSLKKLKASAKSNRTGPKASRSTARPINPFELKFNRQKHVVLNRKQKGSSGNPGLARYKGQEIV